MATFNPWQQALYAASSGLMAAGSPGGFRNFGAGVGQGVGQFQDQQSRLVREQLLQKQMEREDRQYEAEQAKTAAEQKRLDALRSSAGGLLQTYDDADPANDAFGTLTPAQLSVARLQLESNPEGLLTTMEGWTKDGDFKPNVEEFFGPDNTKYKGYLDKDGQIVRVGDSAPLYAPERASNDGTWDRYVDPVTKRTGQKNSKTGKIDWDPGNTVMTQIGTDAQGNPIFDLVSGSPGPTKEFEQKAANQSVLLEQGLGELERLYASPDVSAFRIAGADQLGEMGPLGNVAGQKVMSAGDKQFVSGRARALESLANTITGAAFTEQQKQNFQAMLPQATDDAETAKIKIRQAREYLQSLKRNAKVIGQPSAGEAAPKAPADMSDDELLQELGN